MFPETSVTDTVEKKSTSSMGKSFLFDFDAGDFSLQDGKPSETKGAEALKVWIIKTIKTEKYKFDIYGEYGTTLLDLINNGYPQVFIESEMQREITEALLKNIEISGVTGFTFTREKRGLNVAFSVSSIYGSVESEVTI